MRVPAKSRPAAFAARAVLAFAALCAGAAAAQAGAASAESPAPANGLTGMFAGEKVYTTDFSGYYPRDDIWIFAPDGTLTGNYTEYKVGLGQHYIHDEGTETGRWRVADGSLCLTWDRRDGAGEDCYRIGKISAPPEGPDIWGAEHTAGGKNWRFVFARYVTLGWPWGPGANWGLPFHRLTDRPE